MAGTSKKIGVLVSGGLDSAALVGFYLNKKTQVWPIYIRCGLRWENNEIFWAKRYLKSIKSTHLKPLTILNFSLEDAYDHTWSKTGKTPGRRSADDAVFLPARNMLLVTKALLHLSSNKIYQLALATLKGNPFPDGKRSYFNKLGQVLSKGFNKKISIQTPFRTLSKKQILQKVKKFPIHLSLSCINPKNHTHCGWCNKCAERKKAFQKAGMDDLTRYQSIN